MCRDERVHELFVTPVNVMLFQGLNGKIKTGERLTMKEIFL